MDYVGRSGPVRGFRACARVLRRGTAGKPRALASVCTWCGLLLLAITSLACTTGRDITYLTKADLGYYREVATRVDRLADPESRVTSEDWSRGPRTLGDPRKDKVRNLPLSEAIQTALENSSVIKTRGTFLSPGNSLLANADRVPSVYDAAIQDSGVLFGGRGVSAALAAFDPSFTTTMVWGRNELPQNNQFLGAGLGIGSTLVSETGLFTSELRKQFGYGAQVSVGHDWNYFGSNVPGQLFNSSYTGNLAVRYRQPLLAGAGTEFTRIAGPVTQQFRGLSGVSQGVVIARINNDISLTAFESNVLNLLKDVEDLYWELSLAYRRWDSAVTARDSAHRSWQDTKTIIDAGGLPQVPGRVSPTPADEAQTRDNYFRTRASTESALARLYATETAFRRLIGLPVNDGTILRPTDEPVTAKFVPDWKSCLIEAMVERVELRRQKWGIKSLQLQLKAASSLTRPRLDLVSSYQVNAFGDDLLASSDDDGVTSEGFASGYGTLTQGNHTGWNLGFEFTVPLGMRSANAQVRNLELRLAKAREVLEAQELEISHELADAFQSLAAHFAEAQSGLNRRRAARRRVELFDIEVKAGRRTIDDLLRAQASLAEAEIAYYTSLVAYNQAITNLQSRKGTLLPFNNVHLAEGQWNPEAYRDAMRRALERTHGLGTNSLKTQPAPFIEEVPPAKPPAGPRTTASGSTSDRFVMPLQDGDGGWASSESREAGR